MFNFFSKNKCIDERYYLDGNDYNHIVNVLRFKVGEKFLVSFDGKSDLSSLYGSLFTPYGAEFGDVESYRVRRGGGSYVDVILKSDKTPREWIIKKFFASYRTSARGVVDNCQGFRVAYVAKWGER